MEGRAFSLQLTSNRLDVNDKNSRVLLEWSPMEIISPTVLVNLHIL